MRADQTIRKTAVGKNYLRMLAIVSRELVAAIAITPEISLSVGKRKKTAGIPNIPVPNCRGMRNCLTTGTDESD